LLEELNKTLIKQRKEIEEEKEKNLKRNFKEITESSSLSTPLSSS
jgi:molybdopterin converting factor small subunit